MLWPCGRDECDVSIDKREDFISLFSVRGICNCAFLLIPFYYYFGATSN
jgi:hypothetical protein